MRSTDCPASSADRQRPDCYKTVEKSPFVAYNQCVNITYDLRQVIEGVKEKEK